MKVSVVYEVSSGPMKLDFTCTHVLTTNGVLRLEKRPSQQQQSIGMYSVEHVISIPLHRVYEWKEIPS